MLLLADKITIIETKDWHLPLVASSMRQADIDEIYAASGRGPLSALRFSVESSSKSWSIMIEGKPEGIFGIGMVNVLAGIGAPWLLGTDVLTRHTREFLRKSIACRDYMLYLHPHLRNFVDTRNHVSVRWLKWLGFTFSSVIDINGQKFRMFEMRSSDVRYRSSPDNR